MEYRVQTAQFDRLNLDGIGVSQPLCNDCITPDCTNPIREHKVQEFTELKMYRLYTVNRVVRSVVNCEGYDGPRNLNINKQDLNI